MPIPPLVGRKKIIFPFEKCDDRISCCPMFSLFDKRFNWTITIIDIDRITIGFLLSPENYRLFPTKKIKKLYFS
jgi:hypothetical protein